MHIATSLGIKIHFGAKPHTGKDNIALMNVEGAKHGWKISIETQPPQSSDLNKLDLCFFHILSRQADALKHDSKTLEDMIARIEEAYWSYDIDQLQRVNALIYVVYCSILENEGHNQ